MVFDWENHYPLVDGIVICTCLAPLAPGARSLCDFRAPQAKCRVSLPLKARWVQPSVNRINAPPASDALPRGRHAGDPGTSHASTQMRVSEAGVEVPTSPRGSIRLVRKARPVGLDVRSVRSFTRPTAVRRWPCGIGNGYTWEVVGLQCTPRMPTLGNPNSSSHIRVESVFRRDSPPS